MAGAPPRVLPAGPAPSNVMIVAQALREALAAGRYAGGERIKEIPLAQQMGVSRGPIRDALRLLHEEGLVELLPNRGAVVPLVQVADVIEVYVMRTSLGALALRRLTAEQGSAAAARLAPALRRLERAVQRGEERQAAEADLAFQTLLVSAAELPRVAREFGRLTWQVRMFIATLDVRYTEQLPVMLDEVRAIHAAIAASDRALAQRLWREKFERWMQDFVSRLDGEQGVAALWSVLIDAP